MGVMEDSPPSCDAEGRHPSLVDAVEPLRGGNRSLDALPDHRPPKIDRWVPESALLDPGGRDRTLGSAQSVTRLA